MLSKGNHPIFSWLIAFVFQVITLAVVIGIVYHFTLYEKGPQILGTLKKPKTRSDILTEIRKHEEYEVHRHFHNIVTSPKLPEELLPVCYICHSDYPHSKHKKVRSLLNMHTQFLVCESCHIKQKKGQKEIYKWYNPIDPAPKGPFFGTSYNKDTGNLAEVEDRFSKITPFLKEGKSLKPHILVQDAPLAKDYMRVRDQLSPEQRDNVKKKFHVNIKPKGHECADCHKKDGLLKFRELGFSQKRLVDLEQLNIKGMITKYEKFYLPDLLRVEE